MKCIIFFPSIENCGPTNVVLSIINNISLDSVDIYAVYLWGADKKNEELLKDKCNVILKLDGFSFKSFVKFKEFIKEIKPDIIHSHCFVPDVFTGLMSKFTKKLNVKTLSTVHCNLKEDYFTEYRKIKTFFFLNIHKFFLLKFNSVVTVSNSAAECLKEIDCKTIYNGINELGLDVTVKEQAKGINVFFIGRLIPRKNVSFLIDSLGEYNYKHNTSISLHIFGDGVELLSLKNRSANHVVFHGFTDSPLEFANSKTILVNPAFSEGMPMAVLESISVGVPALLSNIKSHREIKEIIPIGVSLFDFNYSDFEKSLNSIVNEFFFDEAKNRELMYSYFSSTFTSLVLSNRYFTEYKNIISSRNTQDDEVFK